MPNIPQVKIGNVTYDIKDNVARNQIDDLRKTITSINMEFETGDLIISSGETDQDERFCHSDYINVEDIETNIFNLNGADFIRECNYAEDHSFINGRTYTPDGFWMDEHGVCSAAPQCSSVGSEWCSGQDSHHFFLRSYQLLVQQPLHAAGYCPSRRLVGIRREPPLGHLPLSVGCMEHHRGGVHEEPEPVLQPEVPRRLWCLG